MTYEARGDRRNVRRFTIQVVGSLVAVAGVGFAFPSLAQADTTPTVKVILKDIDTAISKEAGVHVKLTSNSGSTLTKIVADIGESQGIETITTGTDRVVIRLDSSYAFVAGNAGGLTSVMGLSAAEQKKVGKDFISAKIGTKPYRELVPNVTMKFVTNFLPSAAGARAELTTVDGNYVVSWSKAATAATLKEAVVLVVSSKHPMLPVTETVTTSSGTASASFTRWGEKVTVPMPPLRSVISYADAFS
jgi:hypothetical protein